MSDNSYKVQATRELLNEMGNAADLTRGPAAAVDALISLFEVLNQQIADTNAELDKLAQNAARPIGGGIGAFNAAVTDARTNLANLFADLNNAGTDNDAIKTEIEHAKELTTVKLEGQKKVIEALLKEEEIRARVGKASPDQLAAIQARGQAELDQVQRAIDLTKGSSSLVLEQSERQRKQGDIHQENLAAQSAAESAQRKKGENDAVIARMLDETGQGKEGANNAIFQQSQNAIDEASKKLGDLKVWRDMSLRDEKMNPHASGEDYAQLKKMLDAQVDAAQADLDEAQNDLTLKRKKLAQAQAQAQGIDDAAADTAAKAADKKAADVTNQARLRGLPGMINQAQKTESTQFFADDVSQAIFRSGAAIAGENGGQIDVATAKAHLEAGRKSAQELVLLATEAAKSHVELLPQITTALAAQKAANLEAIQKLQQQVNQLGKQP